MIKHVMKSEYYQAKQRLDNHYVYFHPLKFLGHSSMGRLLTVIKSSIWIVCFANNHKNDFETNTRIKEIATRIDEIKPYADLSQIEDEVLLYLVMKKNYLTDRNPEWSKFRRDQEFAKKYEVLKLRA